MRKNSPPYYAVFIISATAIAYEILLIRIFSIIQWHHFAYMVISLALLGYAASGTFQTLFSRWLMPRFTGAFLFNAVAFALSMVGTLLLALRLPFNALEIAWDIRQWGYLAMTYLLLSIPFFFAASCVCLTLSRFGRAINRVYSFDLLGAGIGALAVVMLLFFVSPGTALRGLAMLALVAAALAAFEFRAQNRLRMASLFALAIAIIALLPGSWLEFTVSEYKGLRQALQVPGTEIVAERSSPLGLITVIRSPQIPLRQAPGLSLRSPVEPPRQLGVFTDGDGLTAINYYDGDQKPLMFLDYLTSALPYHLARPERVLVLGMGGGSGLLQAYYHDAAAIDAVELNADLVALFQQTLDQFSGWSLLQNRVRVYVEEARGFLTGRDQRYDLIEISLLDSASASSAGLLALSENYLYTQEGIHEYLRHLHPGGMLAMTRWLKLPPRDGLKLFATAIEALRLSGVQEPGHQMVMIRGWKTSTLLIKNGRFGREEIERMMVFCRDRFFDVAYYPGITANETNHFNQLPEPYYYQGAIALLGEAADDYLDKYKFDISPATDERPYFFKFFKWSAFPEIRALYHQGGMSLLELGYLVLIVTLVQAFILSIVLILLPLWFAATGVRRKGAYRWRVALYFLVIGLGFLFVEIAFIQKFSLFLHHPLYAAAVVLSGFLLFAGLGSRYAEWFQQQLGARAVLKIALLLGFILLGYIAVLPVLFSALAGLSEPLRILISLLLIMPLAFCLGMPFPLALKRVSICAPALVPWAWAINGCASTISAVLAAILAIHLGFTSLVLLALLLYLVAGMVRL